MADNTRSQIGDVNNPRGLTIPPSNETNMMDSNFLRGISQNVKDALTLSNLGVDPEYFKKIFSLEEKSSFETIESLKELTEKFEKYMDKAHTSEEKRLVEQEYQNKVEEIRTQKQQELEEAQQQEELERMSVFFEKTESILAENDESIRGALLGPLNLITKPFEEFLGFDLGKSFRGLLFGNKSKKNPKASDVAKIGVAGAGYLYIANTIKSVFKTKEEEDDGNSYMRELFSKQGFFKKFIGSGALKGLGIGSIIGSLLMMVTDGIIGAINAEANNVSKFSGFLGAFLGGNKSGIKGALANSGKWALMGFGVGALLAPVTGGISLLVGPLLGLVVGGVLGAIGGVKIAEAFDAFGQWFKDNVWVAIKDLFSVDKFTAIWKESEDSIGQKIWNTVLTWIETSLDFLPKLLGYLKDILMKAVNAQIQGGIEFREKYFKDKGTIKETFSKIGNTLWGGLKDLWGVIYPRLLKLFNFLKDIVFSIGGFFKDLGIRIWGWMKPHLLNIWENIKNIGISIKDKFMGVVNTIWGGILGFFNKIKEFGISIKNKFMNMVNTVKEGILGFFNKIKELGISIKNKFMDIVNTIWGGIVNFGEKVKNIAVAFGTKVANISKSIKEGITKVIEFIPSLFNKIGDSIKQSGAFVKKLVTDKNFRKQLTAPISDMMGKIFSKISTSIKGVAEKIGSGFDFVKTSIIESSVGQFFTNLFTKVGDSIQNVKNIVPTIVDNVGQFFTNLFTKAKDSIKNLGVAIIESPFSQWVQSIFTKMGEGIEKFFKENPVMKFLKKWVVDPIAEFFTTIGDYFGFIKSLGFSGVKDIIFTDKTWESEYQDYKYKKDIERQKTSVNDAIIRPNGAVIETNPRDTLVALKDIPLSLRNEEHQRMKTNLDSLSSSDTSKELVSKLDKVVTILQSILKKEPTKLTLPPMVRQDLDLIMSGGII